MTELDILLEAARLAGGTIFYDQDDGEHCIAVIGLACVPERPMNKEEAVSVLKEVFGG